MMILDHLAVSGATLDAATDAIESALGVRLQPGGQHPVFGTHNQLLGLEDGLYLEAIAIDPAAPAPDRPRWFDLDRRTGPARLTNWICRSEDLTTLLPDLRPEVGRPIALTRGALAWDMVVPDDGVLPFDNMHPALIQWRCADHPAQMLAPSGCRLHRLTVAHPQAATLQSLLKAFLKDDRVAFETADAPGLCATFDTPHGQRTLE